MRSLSLVAVALLCVSPLQAQEPKQAAPSLFPSGYLDNEALTAALRRAEAAHPGRVHVRSLVKTLQGRDVWLVTLGRPQTKGNTRPAILVVANLEADHVVGSQVALGLIERLAKELDPEGPTIYIVPRLNVDGAERVLRRPLDDFRTNLRAMDRDRDGRLNEDGPEDLDGDGLVTRMRVKGNDATLVPDEKEPRLLRRADPAKGERAIFYELSEGIDNDGDGKVNEDPAGGVNLNRNWPHRWTEFDLETGYSPASEPPVHALIQFAFDHPEIAVVWSFCLQDNLRAEPKKPESTLNDADLPYFAELSRLFAKGLTPKETPAKEKETPKAEPAKPEAAKKEAAKKDERTKASTGGPRRGRPATPLAAPARALLDGSPTSDGSLSEWAYHQYGAVGLASRLWAAPELPEPAAGQPAPPADGEARWLYWNDHVMAGKAFVPFRPFDHPTLGNVEIGGWHPGVRLNPPASLVDAIAESHAVFLKALVTRLPKLAVVEVKVESKGGALFPISAVVENDGFLPTALAQGVRTRKAPPVLVRLQLAGGAKLLTGQALHRVDTLTGSGGRQEFRWLVQAPESVKSITLEIACPKAGKVVKTIELKATAAAQ
jgi:hypothetical protein